MKSLKLKQRLKRNILRKPRALGVLLCYNDADILADVIDYLIANHHEIIVWDHGSDDDTSKVLDSYGDIFVERKYIPREFDFYKLYPRMSKHLIDNYISDFDWISWPDQDEILEGPDRKKSYYEYLIDVFNSKYNWIQFNNFNFWFTEKDDPSVMSPIKRIRYYSLWPTCAPRIRSWRANITNIREFNHNKLEGERFPELFNLRHYSMRSERQMLKRLNKDRVGIRQGTKNNHYENMLGKVDKLKIPSSKLHFDNEKELSHKAIFDWEKIYRDTQQ